MSRICRVGASLSVLAGAQAWVFSRGGLGVLGGLSSSRSCQPGSSLGGLGSSLCTSALPLPGKPLPYRGVLVALTEAEVPSFASRLAASISRWKSQGLNACMLSIPIEHAGLASVAALHGFEYHHAEGGCAVLKCWLKPAQPDKVPPFATHQVGAAGFVVNERNELLVVREWRDTGRGREVAPQWKLPGGLLDRGESFREASTREVFEETGVRTEFRSLMAFWHRHRLTWSQSDLYFVARLHPLSHEIEPQISEISEARWMPIDEFVQTQDHPLILPILKHLYGLDKGVTKEEIIALDHVAPFAELIEDSVQWPGREPYPTYFPVQTGTPRPRGSDRLPQ